MKYTKQLMMVLFILILLISGCSNKTFNGKMYMDVTFEEIEQADCKTITKWYNNCDDEGVITWKQDCRGKFLPYILECNKQ